MGCICSKGSKDDDRVDVYEKQKQNELNKSMVQLVAPTAQLGGNVNNDSVRGNANNGSVHQTPKSCAQTNPRSVYALSEEKNSKTLVAEKPAKNHYQRSITFDSDVSGGQPRMSRILSIPQSVQGEQIAAGWPSWLSSVAAEAIQGWVPRRADSFEKLDKIGQGAYSSVYKARDLENSKYVALKKVRFSNVEAESVCFMAREILILRKLDHPNVMKLEGLVTSRMSASLYLVFEYMEHDLAGLQATPGVKFTELQVKCYMQQMLLGLEHCHSRGVLHRDIKGSNLLIDNNGILKIGDFGLAIQPDKDRTLTSRVVTLWYRAPELLLGATDYGTAIDLWSAGCILAELFAGKPIMPGRTEVEQMHKILKLCGSPSPSADYWQRRNYPHATSFKPQRPYKRRIAETFKDFPSSALALVDKLLAIVPEHRGSASSALKSEFFTTNPIPCEPSSLTEFPPSKELNAKLRDEENLRRKTKAVQGCAPMSVTRDARHTKVRQTSEFKAQEVVSIQGKINPKTLSDKCNPHEDGGSGFRIEPSKVSVQNGYTHSTSRMHSNSIGQSLNKRSESMQENLESGMQRFPVDQAAVEFSSFSLKRDNGMALREAGVGYVPKKNRMHYSGPLMPARGNIDDMLKEHEKLMQEAFRNVRKDRNK